MSISQLVGQVTNPYPPTPPTPTPPPGQYPASFYTGPLGNNNVVPNDPNGAIVITATGIAGHPNGNQGQRDMVLQRMAETGRSFDGIHFQQDGYTVGAQSGEDWIHSLGALPCHYWNTWTSPATILSGASNSAIDAEADRFRFKPYRVMIRLMHEFDMSHLPYHYAAGGTAQWVSAWRYIVERIHNRGATNCGFWWCPTEQGGGERSNINACYPGDDYVDWVGSDLYNNVGGSSTPLHGGWAEFNEMISYGALGWGISIMEQFGDRKPYVVGETGTRYDDANPSRKGNWFRNIDAVAKENAPQLRGIAFFDQDTGTQEYNDWRVDIDQTYEEYLASLPSGPYLPRYYSANAYQGYKDFMALPRWRGGIRAAN